MVFHYCRFIDGAKRMKILAWLAASAERASSLRSDKENHPYPFKLTIFHVL